MNIETQIIDIENRYEKNNDWINALSNYLQLNINYPDDNSILQKIGWCQSRLEKYDEAAKTYSQLVKKQSNNAKWYYMVGYQYYSKKDWEEAINWFEAAVKKYPEYLKAKYRLGYALSQRAGNMFKLKSPDFLKAYKELDECIEIWNKLPENKKKNDKGLYADICYQKGKILIERQDWKNAILTLNESVEIQKTNEDYNYALAKALYGNDEFSEALDVIKKLPPKYYIQRLKANIFIKLESYDEALKIYKGIEKTKKKDFIYREISSIYLKKDDLKEAYQFAQKAMDLNRKNHKNHCLLAEIYLEAGLLNSAKLELEKACNIYEEKYNSKYLYAQNQLYSVIQRIKEENFVKEDKSLWEKIKDIESPDKIYTGTITNYFADKGYGFIKLNNNKVFFHISDIPHKFRLDLREGYKVKFNLVESQKGLSAKVIAFEKNT